MGLQVCPGGVHGSCAVVPDGAAEREYASPGHAIRAFAPFSNSVTI